MVNCSGLQWKDARLAIEHPSWPIIIDSGMCARLTLSAPEPTVLILGLHSWLPDLHGHARLSLT